MTTEWLWGFVVGWICCGAAGAIAYLVHQRHPEFETTSQFMAETAHLEFER